MPTERTVSQQALAASTVLALGVLYVVLLSVGALAQGVKRLGTSVVNAGGSIGRRLARTPTSGR